MSNSNSCVQGNVIILRLLFNQAALLHRIPHCGLVKEFIYCSQIHPEQYLTNRTTYGSVGHLLCKVFSALLPLCFNSWISSGCRSCRRAGPVLWRASWERESSSKSCTSTTSWMVRDNHADSSRLCSHSQVVEFLCRCMYQCYLTCNILWNDIT